MLKIAFSFVLAGFALLCSPSLQAQTPEIQRLPPSLGVRVIEVIPGGQAERAGIQVMDLLNKYGRFTVIDHSTYYKARAEYLRNPNIKVPVQFWRGQKRLTIKVVPGNLGIVTNEYNVVAYELDAALKHIDLLEQIPEWQRDVEFKDAFAKQGGIPEGIRKAQAIVERAEAEGTLTATQILVARIRMIRDDAPAEELKQQEVLLADFVRHQPAEYSGWLGEQFQEREHYRPAKTLLQNYLLSDPDNVWVRLHLSYVNLALRLYDEADTAADQALANTENITADGVSIGHSYKAMAAIGCGDYKLGITYAEKAFVSGGDAYALLLIQLAAAATGDLELFNQTTGRIKGLHSDNVEVNKLPLDSAEALALAMSGHEERARAIVTNWSQKDRVEGKLRHYWSEFPMGHKVVENWLRLTAKN